MLVMLAYDTPEGKDQTFLRTEFERMGGRRVQYSLYLFEGEDHECERVIRFMKRVAAGIPGDIRLIPLDRAAWEAQIVISGEEPAPAKRRPFGEFVTFWESVIP
jgi:CRISPR-associated endonuclease Cas2